MDEQRIHDMIQKVGSIAAAREPVEAIFIALEAFEEKTRRYNRRHLANPSPTRAEWTDIYADVEPHADQLARTLVANREPLSSSLTTVLDGIAGVVEAAALGIDAPSLLRQFSVQTALKNIGRVSSKLGVFLHSWGRPSLREYRGPGMSRAIDCASGIEREASYFANYFDRLLIRSIVGRRGGG